MRIFQKKKDYNKPEQGWIYAVTAGDYVGEMLVYIRSDVFAHNFLSLPEMVNRRIPKDKFIFGMNEAIIEFVENVPKKYFGLIEAQFNKNEKSDN